MCQLLTTYAVCTRASRHLPVDDKEVPSHQEGSVRLLVLSKRHGGLTRDRPFQLHSRSLVFVVQDDIKILRWISDWFLLLLLRGEVVLVLQLQLVFDTLTFLSLTLLCDGNCDSFLLLLRYNEYIFSLTFLLTLVFKTSAPFSSIICLRFFAAGPSLSSHTFFRLSISPFFNVSTPILISSGMTLLTPYRAAMAGLTVHGEATAASRSTQSRMNRRKIDFENARRSRLGRSRTGREPGEPRAKT